MANFREVQGTDHMVKIPMLRMLALSPDTLEQVREKRESQATPGNLCLFSHQACEMNKE